MRRVVTGYDEVLMWTSTEILYARERLYDDGYIGVKRYEYRDMCWDVFRDGENVSQNILNLSEICE